MHWFPRDPRGERLRRCRTDAKAIAFALTIVLAAGLALGVFIATTR